MKKEKEWKKEILNLIKLPARGTKLKNYSRRELTLLILYTIAAGTLVCSVLALPGLGVLLKFVDARSPKEHRRIVRRMKSLESGGYITKRGGMYRITSRAENYLTEEAIWSLSISTPKRWDKKWRIVVFDIPAKKQKGRTALRLRLKELHCFKYQDSVFVHPYDVENVVRKIAKFYHIEQHINFMLVERLDREQELRRVFHVH